MNSTFNISSAEASVLNEWAGYLSHKPSWIFSQFIYDQSDIRAWFTGNQFGKNANISKEIVMRILGVHPIEKRNMRPDTPIRTLRLASETLPNDPEGEVTNTQYPAIKMWLPPSLIKKDITHRNSRMIIHDPQGGKDIIIEFTGYNQTVQRQAGVQRFLVWLDESAPKAFYEEQLPRLIAARESGHGGDLIYSLTPAEFLSWEFDELYERGQTFYRTQAIVNRIHKRYGKKVDQITKTDSDKAISIFQAATDDNPVISTAVIEDILGIMDDEDVVDIRRYGLFKQVSGIIFKDFDSRIHVHNPDEIFPEGVPDGWTFGRFVDYHELNPWAIVWMAISPRDEVFVWEEMMPSPEKMITYDITRQMAHRSGDYRYKVDLADPLAVKKQPNTGKSAIEDINEYMHEFKKEGICTGGHFESWDTKSTRGREEIRKRLHNSKIVKKPFNNRVVKNGNHVNLPTIWFMSNCKNTILSMKNWKRQEYASREMLLQNDQKEKVQQKWSHFPMCLEAAFKDYRWKYSERNVVQNKPYRPRFQGRS